MTSKYTYLLFFSILINILGYNEAYAQCGAGNTQLFFTSSGGSWVSEKWVSITTGPNGTGTVIWAQGNGTYGNSPGLVTDAAFCVTNGSTYYINAYDKYDDGWDGTVYSIRTAAGGGGTLVCNNGGTSPNDGSDLDASSAFGDTQLQELEVSESFSYTPTYCTTGLYITGCSDGDDINSINISDLTQTSTGCTGGINIANYTGTTVNFLQNSVNPFTITCNFTSSEYTGWWIDFNDNASFEDAGEFVGSSGPQGTNLSGNVTIPVAAALGNHRMRVRVVYNTVQSLTTSCTQYDYGETHDYTCNISSACTPPALVTVSPGSQTQCGGTVQLTASGGAGGTIYWQNTTSGGTSTADATNPKTVSASGTYYFRSYNGSCWGTEGSAVVTINPVPAIVTISGGGNSCGSALLTASGGAGGTIYWQNTTSGGTSTASTTNPQSVSATGTYYFRSRSAAGCWGTEGSDAVTINPLPAVVSVSPASTTQCSGSVNLTASGGAGGTIYWQNTTSGGTSTASTTNPQSVSATGTYYFRSSSAAGCWGTEGSAAVTVDALATTADAGSDQTFSISSVTMAANTPGVGTGNWAYVSGPGGSSITTPSSPTSGITSLTNGSYIFSWTITNGACSSTDQVSLFGDIAYGLKIGNDLIINGTLERVNDDAFVTMMGATATISGTDGVVTDAKIRIAGNYDFDLIDMTGEFNTVRTDGPNTLTINGSRTINCNTMLVNTGGTLTLSAASTVNQTGDWTNNGTLSANSSSTVNFSGSSAQDVISGVGATYGNVTVNNSITPSATDGIVLADDLKVATVLTLTDGIIITGTNKVSVTGDATSNVVGDSIFTNGWIFGNIERAIDPTDASGTYNFPVGTATTTNLCRFIPVGLDGISEIYCYFKENPATPNTNFPSGLTEGLTEYTSVASEGVWVLNPTGSITGDTYSLKLYFEGLSGLANDQFNIISRPADPGDGSTWTLCSGTFYNTDVADKFAYRTGINTFSEKGIGKTAAILPVELLYLDGECVDGSAKLLWATATENNNDYFTVEKGYNPENFDLVTIVNGAGNSTELKEYSIFDYRLIDEIRPDVTYYRLLQTDFDGKTVKYEPIAVYCEKDQTLEDLIIIKTDNNSDFIEIILRVSDTDEYNVFLIDNVGKTIVNKSLNTWETYRSIYINKTKLSIGVYNLVVQTKDKVISKQIAITR